MTASTFDISIPPSTDVRDHEHTSVRDRAAEEACAVCPHEPASHDAIAARFCSATRDGAIVRGCVCRS